MPMSLQRIDHIGINVHDLAISFQFYHSVFGFEIIHKWKTTWMIGKDNIRIGVFERKNALPVCNIDQAVAITHVAFRTDADGFAAAQEQLKKLGIAFDPPEDTGIAYSIFVLDPDGHQVEVTSYDNHP